jgi:hypothetical protein
MKILSFILWSSLALTATAVNTLAQGHSHKNQSQKDSKKGENNDGKHRHDKMIKAERMGNEEHHHRDEVRPQHAPFVPFSRTNITVVKQRNVRMFQTLPDGYSSTIFGGRNFYHYGGRYYGYSGNMYSMVAAPIGIHLRLLPVGTRRVFIDGVPHSYYAGVYYRGIGGNEYEVVEPSIGTIVPELPDDNVEEVMLNGQRLYEYDHILYKSVVTKNGVQYEVVGKLGD